MACTETDTFHDLMRKAATEYDRIYAENAFLHSAAFDLHGNVAASSPPYTWPEAEGDLVYVGDVPQHGGSPTFRDNVRDTLVVPANEPGAATLEGEASPGCASDTRDLPVLTPCFPNLLSAREAPSDPVPPGMRGQMVAVPHTPGISLQPIGPMEVPKTQGTVFMPAWYKDKSGSMGVRPLDIYKSIHARLDELAASHARLNMSINQPTQFFSSGSAKSPRARVKKKRKSARSEAVLPKVNETSGRFKVDHQFTVSEDRGPERRPRRPSLVSLPTSMRRLMDESTGSGALVALRRVVYSSAFNTLFASMVVAHVLFIGYEADWVASNLQQNSETLMSVHIYFNLAFLFEVVLRMLVGCDHFFRGREWRWNCLDLCVVMLSTIDFFVLRNYVQLSQSGGIRTLRFARILRLIRTVRLLRAVKSVHELHKMLYAVLSSMRTLISSSFILAFIMYFFSILFTAASAEQRMLDDDDANLLGRYYGSLGLTCRSLFWAVSDGISWSIVYEPVAKIHWSYGFCFVIYIIIVTFGVMNVVTSIFVESAFMSAQHYRDVIVRDKEHSKEIMVGHVKAVFTQMDADGSGELSSEEMEYFLRDHELRKYFEALDLSADDTRMIFRLLDEDCSGVVDMDEFCEGCLKLRGEAKSCDMHFLLFQVNRFLKKWSAFTEYVEDQFGAMEIGVSSRGPAAERHNPADQ